ncbi:MAG: ribonuclease P protein subunit [Candidatus Pacearchaeota archaeon]|nr:ribonuclease P protein subunit [Candidatus Pacearchaeota archaeon]
MNLGVQVLVGCRIKVVSAKNKALEGIEGRVIEETKNLLVIETKRGIKKLIKEQINFKIEK